MRPARSWVWFLPWSLLLMMFSTIALANTEKENPTVCRISVIFNNIPFSPQLRTGWGFACVIEGFDQNILFDTGSDGEKLLANMHRVGIDPRSIDAVVLSHIHMDHTGGLEAFLAENPNVSVFMPYSFPDFLKKKIMDLGARVIAVKEPKELLKGVHSTGEMGNGIREQALILDTPKGLVVITGCAHPGVVHMVTQAKNYLKKEVYLTMGGFHMMGMSPSQITKHLQALRELGVKNVAPSHCTGDEAIARFREVWGHNFITGGCGAVIKVSP